MVWLENVPVGASIIIYLHEKIEGVEESKDGATFCHGKAVVKPWEDGPGMAELHRTYGVWLSVC